MNVNDMKWFRSMGAEKLMEAEEREREVKDMAEIKEATTLEAVPSDMVVVDKVSSKKMILLGFTSEEGCDYVIGVDKDGEIYVRAVENIKVLLSAAQKKLLSDDKNDDVYEVCQEVAAFGEAVSETVIEVFKKVMEEMEKKDHEAKRGADTF